MDKQKLYDIQRALGVETVSLIEYSLPRPHEDVLDSSANFLQYAHAKAVLESVSVNLILKGLDAFDSLNKYNVQSYVDLAESVTAGYDNFVKSQNGEDYPEMDEIATEIFIEYTADAYAQQNGMDSPSQDAMSGMDMMDKENLPDELEDKPTSWFEKLARKLGFKDIDFKDMLYLYLINKYNHQGGDDTEGVNPMQSMMTNVGMSESQGEALGVIINDTPPELEGWVRSVERKFMDLHPQNWEKALHSTVCEHFIDETVTIVKPIDEASDASLEVGSDAGDDPHATTTANNDNAEDAVAGPKLTPTVKADVKKRQSELTQLIKDYDGKTHFYGDKKPAIFNARDSLDYIMDKCGTGKMCDYKLAQLHLQKLMSPITNLYPPSLIKFLAHGSDGTENELMKRVD